ncbi:MAG: methyltransferase type 12 [Tepidiforma sp.]|nr:MAG: methyltransferase type 12 [Tepidiforma sp.]
MSRVLEPSPAWFEIDPAFYAHGGTCFSDDELAALGEPAGLAALVGPITPENRGEEALSLANLGARVTAWSPDPAAADPARTLAGAAGIELDWRIGPLETIDAGPFDLIYHAWGGLQPTLDPDTRAAHLARLLAPGGRLVLYDRHPFASVVGLHRGLLVVARGYFPFRPADNPWTLGDLLTALAEAGFALDLLDEFPGSERYSTALDALPGLQWELRLRVPAAMLIAATLAFHPAPLEADTPAG